jgi:hypothetical protein
MVSSVLAVRIGTFSLLSILRDAVGMSRPRASLGGRWGIGQVHLIDQATFDAVQPHLRARNPKVTPARVVSGPTLLTGICFCADCGGAMTLRTGKGAVSLLHLLDQGASGRDRLQRPVGPDGEAGRSRC